MKEIVSLARVSLITAVLLISTSAIAESVKKLKARDLANTNIGGCVQLGTALVVNTDSTVSADELKMLRNSIFAQYGYTFKDSKVLTEMKKRGCLRTDVTYSADAVAQVDKANIRMLKIWERTVREENEMTDFDGPYAKTASAPNKRAEMLAGHYCYVMDAKKYFGILYFKGGKGTEGLELAGMMDTEKPSWNEDALDGEKAAYDWAVAYKTLDTTAAGALIFSSVGKWSVGSARKNLGDVVISMDSKHRNLANAKVIVKAPNFKKNQMLECTIAE